MYNSKFLIYGQRMINDYRKDIYNQVEYTYIVDVEGTNFLVKT